MGGSRPDPLTPAEWKIMKIVWEKKSCAARDVYTVASKEHDWTPSTTKTFLRRLTEKGYLKTTRVGNSFLYRPALTARKSLQRAAETLLENAVEGAVAPLLVHMVKQGKLSTDELAELRSLLDELPPTEEDS